MSEQLSLPFPEWRDIPGYEGLYQITKDGLVRAIKTTKSKQAYELMGQVTVQGYQKVSLMRDKVRKMHSIHVLLMLAFVGPRPAGMVINHINRNRGDNRLENLEYCTQMENIHHARNLGWDVARGTRQGSARLNDDTIREIRSLYAFGKTMRELAEIYGVGGQHICRIINRQAWKHVE